MQHTHSTNTYHRQSKGTITGKITGQNSGWSILLVDQSMTKESNTTATFDKMHLWWGWGSKLRQSSPILGWLEGGRDAYRKGKEGQKLYLIIFTKKYLQKSNTKYTGL